AGGHQLDPIRAVLDVATNSLCRLIDIVSEIAATRQRLVWRENIPVSVPARNGDTTTSRDHSRPGDQSEPHAVAQSQLSIGSVTLTRLPQACEPVVKPDLQFVGASYGSHRRRVSQVARRRKVLRISKNMVVTIDEPGQQRRACQVDNSGSLRSLDAGGRSNLFNTISFDQHCGIGDVVSRLHVQKATGLDQGGSGGPCLCPCAYCQQAERSKHRGSEVHASSRMGISADECSTRPAFPF